MKKDKQLTEHYLLPLNLCFLSFFGVFMFYELDKWLMLDAPQSTSFLTLAICGLATVFLASSIKIRKPYFQGFCILLSIVALIILF
ncbi:hypothetical protein SYJ56_03665 [Algoriphagus sp. D3-2-R+10]|uniref:hypothetical protein n=1 Tax=Algoriphagus aurantiacus TaxID=3103948 RepID=UPI002B3A8290|nr:hypothetical protein [Algoriphagus sp. D3-2-R+10]MEB2774387.1 hypothetical protein [Algoriphagus sp. D3-2-R+10]